MRETVEAAWLAWQMAEPFDAAVIGSSAAAGAGIVCMAAVGHLARALRRLRARQDREDWLDEGNVRPRSW